jgi:hypothetical protein
MSLPVTLWSKDWGGGLVPCALVRCITCGSEYAVHPEYDVYEACPFCRSPCIKAVFQIPSTLE